MSLTYTPGKLVLKKDSVAVDPNTDPNFANVSLLLYGNGINGSTSITDNSPSPKTVTAVGNAQISTAQSKFDGASIAFDGTGDYLIVPANSDFVFSTNNFTIEGWVFPTQHDARNTIVSSYPGAGSGNWIVTLESGKLSLYLFPNATFNFTWTTTTTFPLNEWSNFAITRESNTWRLFYNGTIENTSTQTTAMGNLNQVRIGSYLSAPLAFFNGYIADLRITKGVARYNAAFTPPTAPFPNY